MQGALCLWLFLEMVVNWNAMSYLTAIKDYKSILYSFAAAVLVAFITSCVLLALAFPPVESLLFAVVLGYGVMLVWDVLLLHRYFPQSRENPWLFLQWVDQFLPLALTGLFTTIGLFAHLVITWWAAWYQSEGSVLWRAILRCARHACVFNDSDYHGEFCGVGGSEFLSDISFVLQSAQRWWHG